MTPLASLLGLPLEGALEILQKEGRAPRVVLTEPPRKNKEARPLDRATRCVVGSRGEDTLIAADFNLRIGVVDDG